MTTTSGSTLAKSEEVAVRRGCCGMKNPPKDWINRYVDETDEWGAETVHLSPELGFAYVESPKCASTSVKANLLNAKGVRIAGLGQRGLHECFRTAFVSAKSLSSIERSALALDVGVVFSIVRNPYTRLLSAYLDKIHNASPQRDIRLLTLGLDSRLPVDFPTFVNAISRGEPRQLDTHWRPLFHLTRPDIVPYTDLLYFEKIDRDLEVLFLKLFSGSRQSRQLIRRGRRTGTTLAATATMEESIKEIVFDIYRLDFETFGYER